MSSQTARVRGSEKCRGNATLANVSIPQKCAKQLKLLPHHHSSWQKKRRSKDGSKVAEATKHTCEQIVLDASVQIALLDASSWTLRVPWFGRNTGMLSQTSAFPFNGSSGCGKLLPRQEPIIPASNLPGPETWHELPSPSVGHTSKDATSSVKPGEVDFLAQHYVQE